MDDTIKLKKSAFVSGGSRGIGREIVKELVKNNYNVTFTYNKSEIEALSIKEELGDSVQALYCDVKDYDAIDSSIQCHISRFGTLDLLVNNAGTNQDMAFSRMELSDWSLVLDTNLTSVFMHCSKSMDYLVESNGCILNISSISGLIGVPGQVNYSASKSGIIGFTRSLAKEYAGRGVNVNVLCPGFINTDMTAKISDAVRERTENAIPMKCFGSSKDIAKIVSFLSSDVCSYITGQVITIDGGLTS